MVQYNYKNKEEKARAWGAFLHRVAMEGEL